MELPTVRVLCTGTFYTAAAALSLVGDLPSKKNFFFRYARRTDAVLKVVRLRKCIIIG